MNERLESVNNSISNNYQKKQKILIISSLLIVTLILDAYFQSGSCQDGICPEKAIFSGILFIILGIIFGLKLSIRQAWIWTIITSILIFIERIIRSALWVMDALANNPDKYPGFYNTGAPKYGIWFALFDPPYYWFLLFVLTLIVIGMFIGRGVKRMRL